MSAASSGREGGVSRSLPTAAAAVMARMSSSTVTARTRDDQRRGQVRSADATPAHILRNRDDSPAHILRNQDDSNVTKPLQAGEGSAVCPKPRYAAHRIGPAQLGQQLPNGREQARPTLGPARQRGTV